MSQISQQSSRSTRQNEDIFTSVCSLLNVLSDPLRVIPQNFATTFDVRKLKRWYKDDTVQVMEKFDDVSGHNVQ